MTTDETTQPYYMKGKYVNHKILVDHSQPGHPRFDEVETGTVYRLPQGSPENIYIRTEGGAVNLRTGSFYKPEAHARVVPVAKGSILTLSIGGGC